MLGRGGIGIGGIILVGGLLYYSGAGRWISDSLRQLNDNCYPALADLNPNIANTVCTGVGRVFDAAGEFSSALKDKIINAFGAGSSPSFAGLRDAMQAQFGALGGSSERLSQIIAAGPQVLKGDSLAEHFQQAIDSFSIGQHYMGQGKARDAMPWLQQGAMQPQGLGMMSQLSLGDIYSSGQDGIPQDPAVAQLYYQQAQNSLAALLQSNTPQSQQMLQALPASPQAIQQQLNQTIQQLQQAGRR